MLGNMLVSCGQFDPYMYKSLHSFFFVSLFLTLVSCLFFFYHIPIHMATLATIHKWDDRSCSIPSKERLLFKEPGESEKEKSI